MLTNEETINLNVLCSFMKNQIICNLYSIPIVTMKQRRPCKSNTYIIESQRTWTIFLVIAVITPYSASVEEHATTSCFLLHHEINESPRNKQNLVVDWFVVGSPIQSASENARSSRVDVEDMNYECVMEP